MDASRVVLSGVVLIVVGFLVVLSGTILGASGGRTQVRGGGVVFLGPIPLVFGTDKKSALAVSVAGLLLMLAYFMFLRR